MATDSTELTFVRCPSCRSLVPAVSTRCRMCGAGLDPNSHADTTDTDAQGGRVRQRTMSQPQSELNEAVGRLRAEESKTQEPVAAESEAVPTSSQHEATEPANEEADPLSAYIEEVEGDEVASEPTPAPHVEAKPTEVAAPAGAASMGMTSIPAAHILVQKAAPKVSPPEISKTEAPHAANGPVAEGNGAAQKVIIESGMRRPGKGSQLSFGKPKQPEMRESSERPTPAPQEAPSKPAQVLPRRAAPVEQAPQEDLDDAPLAEREDSRQQAAPVSKSREAAPRENSPSRAAQPAANKVAKAAVAGRLFGWLVHYAEPDGVATELREGKFFVTASSLKSTDLIVEEPSISTPHALIVVGTETGLQVQDLMSDRGVFVRRRGADSYQREYEVVSVEHGDWVRFGDVEYLVSLIAHVGAK